jgi:hypothetical protein
MEQINSNKCSNIGLNFEYLGYFLIRISRKIFTDISFSGEVYESQPTHNEELSHLFSLENYPTIEEAIKCSFQKCDEFLIEYPPESPSESNQVTCQVHYDSPDDIPF